MGGGEGGRWREELFFPLLTNEVLDDECANMSYLPLPDVVTQVLQEDSLAEIVFIAECIIDACEEKLTGKGGKGEREGGREGGRERGREGEGG